MVLTRQPLISIVIPVFNMAKTIGPCIESVLNQDYEPVQCIVIDGGSSDGTREVIESFSDRLFFWVSEKDRGQSHAINKGFDVATGDVRAWLNGDEEYLPGALRKVARAFSGAKEIDFVYGDRLVADIDGKVLFKKRYPRLHPKYVMLYYQRVLPTDASFWSREVHEKTGRVDEKDFQHLAMDYDFLLRMSFYIRGWRHLGEPLSIFKEHPQRKTVVDSKQNKRHLELGALARERIMRQYGISRFQLYLGWMLFATLVRFQLRDFSLPHPLTAWKYLQRTGAPRPPERPE